jgi:crossover junction endodeoxyribonuclease RuvC
MLVNSEPSSFSKLNKIVKMIDKRTNVFRVLGIDTSLRSTGVAVVEAAGNKFTAVDYRVLKTARTKLLSECLRNLHEGVIDIIDSCQPDAVAVEGIFFQKNIKTAIILGEARGTVIAACSSNKLPVFEYAPRRVKQAVLGYGTATKDQVCKMVMSILALSEEPPEDASDALSIAICHLHNISGHPALGPKEI